MSLKEDMAAIRKKMGIEVVDEVDCEDCGKKYEVTKRKNTEMEPSYACPHCLVEKENDEIDRRMREMKSRQKIRESDYYSEIPFEIREKTFDDYKPSTDLQRLAKDTAMKFVDDEIAESSLVFQGDTGIGKTHLSYCIKRGFNAKGKSVVMIDSPSLFAKIKNSFGKKDSDQFQEKMMTELRICDLLILDDIGAEYVKPDANGYESWAADIIFQIVNSRLGKQSIYTTNYTSKDLSKKYGMLSKRIISRMMSKAKVIKVDGEDQRLKGFE